MSEHARLKGYPLGQGYVPGLGFPQGTDPDGILVLPPITDYSAWYDASDAASILTESGAVAQWNDKSGNGYHLASIGGSTTRPAYAVGREIARVVCPDFDGSNDRLDCTYHNMPANVYSAFGVVAPDGFAALQAVYASTASNTIQVLITTGALLEHGREATTFQTLDGKLLQAGYPAAFGVTYDQNILGGGLRRLRIGLDSTQQYAEVNDASGSNNGQNLRVGARSNLTNFFDGLMAELIFFTRELQRYEMAAMMSYLMQKWGTG